MVKFANEKDRDYYAKEDPVHLAFAKSIGDVVQAVRYVTISISISFFTVLLNICIQSNDNYEANASQTCTAWEKDTQTDSEIVTQGCRLH